MIKIDRPKSVPKRLTVNGSAENLKNYAAFDQSPPDFISGKSKFEILNNIYGHESVKGLLKKAQKDKCCFCEKDQVEEFGAVEHFRPKNGYKIMRKSILKKPGYYWLGYEWGNLLFVCGNCNSTQYKGNLFPLTDETRRAKSHHDDIAMEDPYLINPALINPRDHVKFQNELVYGKTTYGNQTISICGLDRETLNDKRKELIDNLNSRIVIVSSKDYFDPAEVQRAKEYLKKSREPQAPFSATAIDYLSQFNIQ